MSYVTIFVERGANSVEVAGNICNFIYFCTATWRFKDESGTAVLFVKKARIKWVEWSYESRFIETPMLRMGSS